MRLRDSAIRPPDDEFNVELQETLLEAGILLVESCITSAAMNDEREDMRVADGIDDRLAYRLGKRLRCSVPRPNELHFDGRQSSFVFRYLDVRPEARAVQLEIGLAGAPDANRRS